MKLILLIASTLASTPTFANNSIQCYVNQHCPAHALCTSMGFEFLSDGTQVKAKGQFHEPTILAQQLARGYLTITGYELNHLYFASINLKNLRGTYRYGNDSKDNIRCYRN